MFGEIIGLISDAGPPEDVELALLQMVMYPIEMHVHSFLLALFDSVIDNATGGIVVSLEWCGRLGVSQFI